MNQEKNYKGSCFCGAVEFSLSGEPEAMAYCHCDSCRHWAAGPVNAFTLWNPDTMQINRGGDKIATYDKNPRSENQAIVSQRQWCKSCGGHICTKHPAMGLVDVPAVVIRELDFEPGFHVHYQETVHSMKDGLTKFRDLPKEAGGSGEEIQE